jgi:hypothetical protein
VILLVAAPAWALEVTLDPTFTCGTSSGEQMVGLPGLEVPCVLDPVEDGSTWETTRWSFGDGTTAEGEAVSHVYDTPGQYTVAVELDGWVPPEGSPPRDDESDPYLAKYGLVTVCGPPEPAFRTVDMGGLEVQVENHTTVAVHCLSDLRWDVIPGTDAEGEPELQFTVWEPRVSLPREGTWTFVLTLGGIAGTTSASAAVEARYGLPEGLDVPGGDEWGCATLGWPGSMGG